jgi:hypothetical protein
MKSTERNILSIIPRCLRIERACGQCDIESSFKNRGFQVILHGPFVSTQRSQRSSIWTCILTSDRNRHTTPENRSILTIQKQAWSMVEVLRSRIGRLDRRCFIPKWNWRRRLKEPICEDGDRHLVIRWRFHQIVLWNDSRVQRLRVEMCIIKKARPCCKAIYPHFRPALRRLSIQNSLWFSFL